MKPAACSWRVTTRRMVDVRSDSSKIEVLLARQPEDARDALGDERLHE